MSEQKKGSPLQNDSSNKQDKNQKVEVSSWKKLLAKKWVFPAVYVAAAGIILTLMWVYQDSGKMTQPSNQQAIDTTNQGKDTAVGSQKNPDTVAVTAKPESMQWPVANRNEVKVIKTFYDSKAPSDQKQAAMVEYNNTFTPHMGVDLARPNHQPFDVMAAMSGTVTEVQNNPVVGNLVEITNDNGMVMIYQSLANVTVKNGQAVKQGDVIAQAGQNDLEKGEGVHLHFEIRQAKDSTVLDPTQLLPALQVSSTPNTTEKQKSEKK